MSFSYLLAATATVLLFTAPAFAQTPLLPNGASATLDAVRARGQLRCGTYETVPGFSFVNSKGEMTGLDADLCRAVAAAALGSRERQGWC